MNKGKLLFEPIFGCPNFQYPNNLHVHPVVGGLQFAFAEYDYSVEVALDMIIMIVDKLADGPLKRSLISQMCINIARYDLSNESLFTNKVEI